MNIISGSVYKVAQLAAKGIRQSNALQGIKVKAAGHEASIEDVFTSKIKEIKNAEGNKVGRVAGYRLRAKAYVSLVTTPGKWLVNKITGFMPGRGAKAGADDVVDTASDIVDTVS